MSWSEFWNMGGYGGYVWGSYGVTAALLACEVVLLRRRRSALHARLREARRIEGAE